MTHRQASTIIELVRALGWRHPRVEPTGTWSNQWTLYISGRRFNEYIAAREYIAMYRGQEPQAPFPPREYGPLP